MERFHAFHRLRVSVFLVVDILMGCPPGTERVLEEQDILVKQALTRLESIELTSGDTGDFDFNCSEMKTYVE